jgi:ribulose-5-phosphate 4-epimerase/fuculose-1-phosphate aldolase
MSAALKAAPGMSDAEWETRCQLAAVYHICEHFGWVDTINTHMSARIPGEPEHFLINNYGEMFDEITASSLCKVHLDGTVLSDGGKFNNPQRRLYGASGCQLRAAHAHPRRGRGVADCQWATADQPGPSACAG